jgi:hypothetical protein
VQNKAGIPLNPARKALDSSSDRVASCDSCFTFEQKARRMAQGVDATCLFSRALLVGDRELTTRVPSFPSRI